jgi:O-antigen ligase
MPPSVATVIYAILILILFWLDRDREIRPSQALWIPVIWLLLSASRPVSLWLQPKVIIESSDQYLEANPLNDLVLAVLMAGALIVLVNRRRQAIRLLRANGPVILFFLYCGISVCWSDFPSVAFRHWMRSLGDLVMVLVVLTEADLSAAFTRLLTRPTFVLVPLSILFIKYFPDLGREYNVWTFVPMYCGVATTKNMLGLLCLVFGLGSAWRFLAVYGGPKGGKRNRQLSAHGAVLIMTLWMFWLADSMTSLSCFIMAGGLMVVTALNRSARKPAVLHLLVATVLLVPVIALFSGLGAGMVASLGRDPTLTGRTNIWKVVLSVSGNPLLGAGYESFWLGDRLNKIWAQTMPGLQEAHNGYLEVYLNLGWVGVSLLAVLMLKGYRNVVATLRRDPWLGGFKLALFFAALVYSLTEAGFRMMSLSWISLLLAATTTPRMVTQDGSPVLGIEPTQNVAEPEEQLARISGGFPGEETSISSGS